MADDDKQTTAGSNRQDNQKRRSFPVRAGISTFRVAGFAYIAILVTLVAMETRMVYPGAHMADRPASTANDSIVDVTYTAADGVSLTGRLLSREDSKNTVLFFHGNGTKAAWLDHWAQRLSTALDATVMLAEYRGYGDDHQTPNERGVITDCLAARDFLCQRQGIQPEDIILYGRSLGGGCAVAVAADGGAKTLILDRTFDRLPEVAATRFPFVPVRTLMRNRYDSVDRISRYDGPLVQLHGTTDRVIPFQLGKSLYQSATCDPKHWIGVEGLGHNDSLSASHLEEIARKVEEFAAVGR